MSGPGQRLEQNVGNRLFLANYTEARASSERLRLGNLACCQYGRPSHSVTVAQSRRRLGQSRVHRRRFQVRIRVRVEVTVDCRTVSPWLWLAWVPWSWSWCSASGCRVTTHAAAAGTPGTGTARPPGRRRDSLPRRPRARQTRRRTRVHPSLTPGPSLATRRWSLTRRCHWAKDSDSEPRPARLTRSESALTTCI